MVTSEVVNLVPPVNMVNDPSTMVNWVALVCPSNQQWAAVRTRVLEIKLPPHTELAPPVRVAIMPTSLLSALLST